MPPPPSATTNHGARESAFSTFNRPLHNYIWLASVGLMRGSALMGMLALGFALGWWSKPDAGAPPVPVARIAAPSPLMVRASAAEPGPAGDSGPVAALPAPSVPPRERAAALTAPVEPMTWDEIREIQGRLSGLGYEVGPLDGVAGPQTRAAILQFQAAVAVPETGAADRDLLQRLRDKAGPGR
jgi:hypothetical protein